MPAIAVLKKKWVLALLGLVVVIGGVTFYNWHRNESLGVDGRKDTCAESAGTYGIPAPDDSPHAMQALLSAQPYFVAGLTDSPIPGTPILSHPIRMHTGQDFNDCPHWLLPLYDDTGHLVAIADYIDDYPHKIVRFADSAQIFPGEPRYSNPFPYLSAEQAIALLKQQRNVGTKAHPAPELVFLPINFGLPERPGPAWNWRGGGAVPSDPIWLLAGSDGRDYLIGTDKRVYTLHDIPLS
jgi:hypothetical protein